MPFRNPYYFVPAVEEIPQSIESPKDEPLGGKRLGHRTFDRYHEDTLSGRIVGRLTMVGPVVIGGRQTQDANDGYKRIHPFERNGEPAIPASTLRGCISSVAEAASNSALRVLDDTYYSRRVMMDEVGDKVEDFSAMGIIVEQDGELRLRPLALPTLKKTGGQTHYVVPQRYRVMFPAPQAGTVPELRFKAYCYKKQSLSSAPNAYSQEHPNYYYAKLTGSYNIDQTHKISGNGGHVVGNGILLGLNASADPAPAPPEGESGEFIRGILRVLSSHGRSDIPESKKHELFIPYPIEMEQSPTFEIEKEALNRFQRLAEDRKTENERRKDTELSSLPYALKGSQPFMQRSVPYRLKAGDIVFFVPDSTGNKVAKLWISQIWREEIGHKTHEFFSKINAELLPYSKERNHITPAEALFGFVEVNEKGKTDTATRALASRIRFSEARLIHAPDGGCYHPETRLKILASPKPPCPSFYFRRNNLPNNPTPRNCYVAKRELNINQFRPQGRKFYLNHVIDAKLAGKYRTRHPEDAKNKNKATPLKEGCQFVFRVDFDNLSAWELGLLLYSIKPSEEFHHKIGMAKALGLGTIQMEVAGIFYVDRHRRYTGKGFTDDRGALCPRYSNCWVQTDLRTQREKFFSADEIAAIGGLGLLPDNHGNAPQMLKNKFADGMTPSIRKALLKVGQPGVGNVKPPLAAGQQDEEAETFQWFQNNDGPKAKERQGLVPLEYGDETSIPLLNNNEKGRN
jgi:CRISPR-associated protein (TIGR03986 family)